MSHKFDILIPYAHDHGHLESCVKAVIKKSHDYKILTLNSGAPPKCLDMIYRLQHLGMPMKNYSIPKSLGPCRAHNILLAYSTAPYIVILNDDAIVAPGWLEALQKIADMPGMGMASTMVSNPGTHMSRDRWFTEAGILLYGKMSCLDLPDLSTVCVMIQREIFQEIGYFSERFTFGWDTDYCFRLRRAGYTLGLALDTCVEHYPHSTRYEFDPDEGGEIRTRETALLKELYPEFYA